MKCIEPEVPDLTGTSQEWADYFAAYAEYLRCLAEQESQSPVGSYRSSFETFARAAEIFGQRTSG